MKRPSSLVLIAAVCWMNPASAAEACGQGEKRLDKDGPCMPSQLVNYLYCLEKSGGGKVEFTSKDGTDKSSALQLTLDGKASGIVVKGEVGGNLSKSDSERITKELQAKLDPSLTANCKEFSGASGSNDHSHGRGDSSGSVRRSASMAILGDFGSRFEDVQQKGIVAAMHKNERSNTLFITYRQQLFGRSFEVVQDLDSQNRTGRARASLHLLGGDSWGSRGASQEDTHSMCSEPTFQKMLNNLINKFGTPTDIKERAAWSTDEKDGPVKINADFTLAGAAWKFPDDSRLIFRVRSRDVWRTFSKTEYHFECTVEICAVPKTTLEPCFTVPGLLL